MQRAHPQALRRRAALQAARPRRDPVSVGFLAFLLVTMIGNGARGFTQTEVRLDGRFPALVAVPRSGGACAASAPSRRSPTPISSGVVDRGGDGAIWPARRRRSSPSGARLRAARRGARRSGHPRRPRDALAARRDRDRHRRQERRRRPRPSARYEQLERRRRDPHRLQLGLPDRLRFHRSDRWSASGARSRARC